MEGTISDISTSMIRKKKLIDDIIKSKYELQQIKNFNDSNK